MRTIAAVFVGGAAGTLLRYVLGELLPAAPGAWPWGTFVANLAGAAVLAVLVARREPSPLLGAGVCGALTTFSGLVLEVDRLVADGHAALAAGYLAASLAGGLAIVHGIHRAAGR